MEKYKNILHFWFRKIDIQIIYRLEYHSSF